MSDGAETRTRPHSGVPVGSDGRPGGGFVGFDCASPMQLSGEWKPSAPLVQDGKVVFTGRSTAGAIHCLSLKRWQSPVGRLTAARISTSPASFRARSCSWAKTSVLRPLSLADGKTKLWEVETGMPSGQGAASGNFYYLPLRKGEVCKIDMERGEVAAHSPSPKNEIPGNPFLLCG